MKSRSKVLKSSNNAEEELQPRLRKRTNIGCSYLIKKNLF